MEQQGLNAEYMINSLSGQIADNSRSSAIRIAELEAIIAHQSKSYEELETEKNELEEKVKELEKKLHKGDKEVKENKKGQK